MKSNLKRRLAGETGRPALGGSERTHKKSCRKSLWQSNLRTGMLAWLISEPLTHPYMWPIMERSIQGWSKVASFTRSANLHLAGWHERKEGNIRLIMSKKKKQKTDSLTGNLMLTFSFEVSRVVFCTTALSERKMCIATLFNTLSIFSPFGASYRPS